MREPRRPLRRKGFQPPPHRALDWLPRQLARARRVVAALGARRASCAVPYRRMLHSLWAILHHALGALLEWVLKSGAPADDPQRMWALKTALAEIEKACARVHVCVARAGVPCASESIY